MKSISFLYPQVAPGGGRVSSVRASHPASRWFESQTLPASYRWGGEMVKSMTPAVGTSISSR